MQRLAGIAATFTPQVSIEPPDGLLLEIKPSINLFGGLRELCRRLRDACRADPVLSQHPRRAAFHARTHRAGCARGGACRRALLHHRSGGVARETQTPAAGRCCAGPRNRMRVSLPWACARWENSCACRAPGSPGVSARSCSPTWTGCWDVAPIRARGWQAANVIAGVRDFDHEIEDHERILQALAPLLDELEQFLRVRQRGITALQCRFHHYRAAPTRCTLRLAAPEASAARFTQPAARTAGHAHSARAGAALRVARRRAHASHRGQPAAVVARRTRTCERGRDAGAGRTPARTARRRRGVRHRRVSEHRPEHAWCVAEPTMREKAKKGTGLFNDDTGAGPASHFH